LIIKIDVQFQIDRRPTEDERSQIERDIRTAINKHENLVLDTIDVEFY
jgi:hypothetical protein